MLTPQDFTEAEKVAFLEKRGYKVELATVLRLTHRFVDRETFDFPYYKVTSPTGFVSEYGKELSPQPGNQRTQFLDKSFEKELAQRMKMMILEGE